MIPFEHENKELILNRIEHLKKIKRDFIEKFKKDMEYNSSLKSMIERERLNLNKICENIISLKENSKGIDLTKKSLAQNYTEKVRKNQKINSLSRDFKDEVQRLKGLINTQINNVENVSINIDRQKIELQMSKEQLKEKNIHLEDRNKIKKQEVKDLIVDVGKVKNINKVKENHFFKVIIGLDLLKRYVICKLDI